MLGDFFMSYLVQALIEQTEQIANRRFIEY